MDVWDDDEQLHAFLIAMGMGDELGTMEREDLVRLAQSLRESESSAGIPAMVAQSVATPSAGFSTPPSGGTLPVSGEGVAQEQQEHDSSSSPSYSEEEQEKIASFVGVTNIPVGEAGPFLTAMNWNLESAIGLYLENGGNGGGGTSSANTGVGDVPPAVVGHGIPVGPPLSPTPHIPSSYSGFGSADFDDAHGMVPPLGGSGSIGGSGHRGPRTGGGRGRGLPRREDQYDEFGVRLADEVRSERLMDDAVSHGGFGVRNRGMGNVEREDDPLARAESEEVVWTGLSPPTHLSHPCGWDHTKNHAKEEKKWILVNIQLHTNFDSHQLNNHTWCDETVVELLRSNFVFWQRGSTCPDAKGFIDMYKMQESNLPYIGVHDARTGVAFMTIRGFIPPDILSMTLLDYVSNNDPTQSRAPKFKHIDMTKENSSRDDNDEAIATEEDNFEGLYDSESDSAPSGPSSPTRPSTVAPDTTGATPTPILEPELKPEPEPATADYGPVSAEPIEGGYRIMMKLPTGKKNSRSYAPHEEVRVLYAAALEALKADGSEEAIAGADIDVFQSFPRVDLRDQLDATLEETGLGGSQVMVAWR